MEVVQSCFSVVVVTTVSEGIERAYAVCIKSYSTVTPSVVDVLCDLSTCSSKDSSNVTLKILLVVVVCVVVSESGNTIKAVEVLNSTCGSYFPQNLCTVKLVGDAVLACSDAFCIVSKSIRVKGLKLLDLTPSEIVTTVCASISSIHYHALFVNHYKTPRCLS